MLGHNMQHIAPHQNPMSQNSMSQSPMDMQNNMMVGHDHQRPAN